MSGIESDLHSLIKLAEDIYKLKDSLQENVPEVKRLCDRVHDLKNYLEPRNSNIESKVVGLFTLFTDISKFVKRFDGSNITKVTFAVFRKRYLNELAELNQKLSEMTSDIMDGIAVEKAFKQNFFENQRNEDIQDIRNSLEWMVAQFISFEESEEKQSFQLQSIENLIKDQHEITLKYLNEVGYLNKEFSAEETKRFRDLETSLTNQIKDHFGTKLEEIKSVCLHMIKTLSDQSVDDVSNALRKKFVHKLRRNASDFYISTHQLGKGGQAKVLAGCFKYAIDNGVLNVAIKEIKIDNDNDPEARINVENECINMDAASSHLNIVSVYGFSHVTSSLSYIFMELAPYGSLYDITKKKRGPSPPSVEVPFDIVVTWLRDVLDALNFLHHEMHIIHKDVKAQNILIFYGCIAKLCDFGIAKEVTEDGHTKSTNAGGTRDFMAPELLDNRFRTHANALTDVYAWGATAFQVFSGEDPKVIPAKASSYFSTYESMRRDRSQTWSDFFEIVTYFATCDVNSRISSDRLLMKLADFISRNCSKNIAELTRNFENHLRKFYLVSERRDLIVQPLDSITNTSITSNETPTKAMISSSSIPNFSSTVPLSELSVDDVEVLMKRTCPSGKGLWLANDISGVALECIAIGDFQLEVYELPLKMPTLIALKRTIENYHNNGVPVDYIRNTDRNSMSIPSTSITVPTDTNSTVVSLPSISNELLKSTTNTTTLKNKDIASTQLPPIGSLKVSHSYVALLSLS